MRIGRSIPFVCCLAVGAFASNNDAPQKSVEPAKLAQQQETAVQDTGRVGVGFKISATGIGFEAATRVTHRTNVRAGFAFLDHRANFTYNGVGVRAQLGLRAIDLHYDIFPRAGGFHVSPGLLMFVGDPLKGTTWLNGGGLFTLGNNDYMSDPNHPVNGTVKINWHRVAPMFTVGTGNLVSRKEGKHFTVPFEVGVAFQGAPRATYKLAGGVCQQSYDPTTNALISTCAPVSSNTQFQQDVVSEQNMLNNKMKAFKMYPIASIGFGYKF